MKNLKLVFLICLFISFSLLVFGCAGKQPATEQTTTTDVTQPDSPEVGEIQEGEIYIEQPIPPVEPVKEEEQPIINLSTERPSDEDKDGIDDENDNCVDIKNTDQKDMDGDNFGDACDDDRDGDGISNNLDNCPDVKNSDQVDSDNDKVGNRCDPDLDWDQDGILNEDDNCPDVKNPDQWDIDLDGTGDACDEDSDGDGIANSKDNCPYYTNPSQEDANGIVGGDQCDSEIDGFMDITAKHPLAGGSAVGEVFESRVRQPFAVSIVKKGTYKFLFVGEYDYPRIHRAQLNESGTIEKTSFAVETGISHANGLVTSPDQNSIFVVDYTNGTVDRLLKLSLNTAGEVVKSEVIVSVATDYPNHKLYTSFNPAVSPDGRYIYLPLEHKTDAALSKILCVDLKNGNQKQLLSSNGSPSGGVALVVTTAENNNLRLYFTETNGKRASMLTGDSSDGCSSLSGQSPVEVAKIFDKNNKPLIPVGIVASTDGSKLYLTASYANPAYGGGVMRLDLNPDTGLSAGSPTFIAGSPEEAGWQDGSATESRFMFLSRALALDEEEKRIYAADPGNDTIKLLQLSANGNDAVSVKNLIGTVSFNKNEQKLKGVNLHGAAGIAVSPEKDGIRHIYASNWVAHSISRFEYNVERGIITDGENMVGMQYKNGYVDAAAQSSKFYYPGGMAFSNPPNTTVEKWHLYAADYSNYAVRCIHLNPSNGKPLGYVNTVTTVVRGVTNNIKLPVDVAVSSDGRFVYIVNQQGGQIVNQQGGQNNNNGFISYIEVDPETCYPKSLTATLITQTNDTQEKRPNAIAFYETEAEGSKKSYIYYATMTAENVIKRIELDPSTGGPKAGANVEIVAGAGPAGNIRGYPLLARFNQPSGLAFSQDKKALYVVDRTNRTVVKIDLNDNGTAVHVSSSIIGRETWTYTNIITKAGFGSSASLISPVKIATIPLGKDGISLLVTDYISNSIQQIR